MRFYPPPLRDLPWPLHPGRLFVPLFQGYQGLNDRFAFGCTSVMRRYVDSRWRRMHAPGDRGADPRPPHSIVRGWNMYPLHSSWPECLYGEQLVCWLVTTANLSVAFTEARFVRVRDTLAVPDVDRATVLGSKRLKAWMLRSFMRCPSLSCVSQTSRVELEPATRTSRGGINGTDAVCSVLFAL